jgi:hypothetical protein
MSLSSHTLYPLGHDNTYNNTQAHGLPECAKFAHRIHKTEISSFRQIMLGSSLSHKAPEQHPRLAVHETTASVIF